MEARKKYFEEAVVSLVAAGTDVESDEMYAFEQSAWGPISILPVSDGTADYDVLVSYDQGTTWYTVVAASAIASEVVAPRVKIVARGDDTDTTTVHVIQREFAPTEATRSFTYVEAADATTAVTTEAVEANTPNVFNAVVACTDVTSWAAGSTLTLQTSFDGTNWVDASAAADLDETAAYQEVEITPTVLGNYFRVSFVENTTTADGSFFVGLLVRESI